MFTAYRHRSSILALVAAIVTCPAATAQTAPSDRPPPADDPAAPDGVTADAADIIVTGTRIAGSGFETPSPVTVVPADQLLKSSPSTLAAALNVLPALVSTGGPNATVGQQGAGRNSLNLRGIGVGRTLTLVNGRRFPGSSPGGSVDTNLIPQALVSRVEVVTGGASAAYGSDAVAGVVNFILDEKFQGVRLSAGAGVSARGDAGEYRASATLGRHVAGGRLQLVASGEYYRSDGVDGDARAFRRAGANLIVNPAVTAANPASAANPALIVAPQARINATFGGLIVGATGGSAAARAALVGTQFLPGGATAPYDFGSLTSATLQNGGDGINTAVLQPINRPLERATAYVALGFDATDRLRLFVNAGYGWTRSSNPTTEYHSGRDVITIRSDNAFLPVALRQQLTSAGITAFTMNRYDSEYATTVVATNRNQRVEFGATVKLLGFDVEGSVSIGDNVETAPNTRNYIRANYTLGIDSVLVNGVPTCRSTIVNPANGCVPINPFGAGSYSLQAVDYFTGTSLKNTHVVQRIYQANANGRLFGGIGAGPWGLAFGMEHRFDSARVTSDALSNANAFFTANQISWRGDRTVTEGFFELNAPLLKGRTLFRLLELNGAARRTHYSTSGSVTTWKVGLNYKPIDDLRLRGSISHDIRAPNQAELFTRGQQTTGALNDPFNGGARVPNVSLVVQGNPFLVPEVADTTVIGAVFQPAWLPGFSLSVDRFDIRLKQAIRTLSGQAILDQCFVGFQQVCAQIVRDAGGQLVQVNNTNFNLDQLRLTGIDFEGNYRRPIFGGTLGLRLYAAYLDRLATRDFNNVSIDRAGETTTPRWRALGSLSYRRGAADGFLQLRYIGRNMIDTTRTPAQAAYNDVPAALYVDGQLGVSIAERMDLTFNVQNLLDKQPPFAPEQGTYYSPTNQNVYDQIGRAFRVGVKIEF